MRGRWLVVALIIVLIGAILLYVARRRGGPDAEVMLIAGPLQPAVRGTVTFHSVRGGTLVKAEVSGLPLFMAGPPPIGPHGFHIHEGSSCEVGDPANPFQAAGGHWNPDDQPHGNHAGDFPVLFAQANGKTEMSFFTDRFTPADVVGRSIVIHLSPDDYRTQPAGDSGPRIACGVIVGR